MSYELSVVQLCPDSHKVAAEAVAESLGYGSNNLSVKLQHSETEEVWWGCHAWWVEEVFDQVVATGLIPTEVITNRHPDLDNPEQPSFSGPREHFDWALAQAGLVVFPEEV